MRVGEVSHPHHFHSSEHPSLRAAASHHVLSSAGKMAGEIAARGVSHTAAAAPASETQTQILTADLQAYADLAEIHMFLAKNGNSSNYYSASDPRNKPLMLLLSDLQTQLGLCGSDVKGIISQAQGYYSFEGQDVQFKPPNTTPTSFTTWWLTPSTGGLAEVMNGLSNNFTGNPPSYQPSVPYGTPKKTPNTPAAFVNLCVIYADAMLAPNAQSLGLDTKFWATFGPSFPSSVAVYAYQMEVYENGNKTSPWTGVDATLTTLFNLLPSDPHQDFPNYDTMYNAFNKLQSANIDSFASLPPQYASIFQDNPTSPSEDVIAAFYANVLDDPYSQFMTKPNTP